MKKGEIIFINGVTSSGKTCIAKAIQELANEHYYHISNDMFVNLEVEMLADKFIENTGAYTEENMAESCVLMYHFARIMSEQGINVIIEAMLCETSGFILKYNKSNYDIMKSILSNSDIYIIELFCPLDECRKRNIARGNRGENQSDLQKDMMSKDIKYNLTVNTAINTPNDCAKIILFELSKR